MTPRLTNLLLLTALLPGVALSQTVETVEEEIIPLYDVEIVLFKNLKVPQSREFLLPVSSPTRPENMLDLSSMASVDAAREQGYDLVAADELRLLDLVTRLIKSTRYEFLLHAAWRQPGLEREQVLPVWIKGGKIYSNEFMSIDSQIELIDSLAKPGDGEDGSERNFEFDEQTLESQELQLLEMKSALAHDGLYELEGKITIVLSRFLHTYIDLVLRRPRQAAGPAPSDAATETAQSVDTADAHILNNHHLREHRRMRSKNLHYIDSPEFGMLILITPYEVVEGSEEILIEPEAEIEPIENE